MVCTYVGTCVYAVSPQYLSLPATACYYLLQQADLPVYFGDAGSPAVLHLVGAERAACAIIALDTPGRAQPHTPTVHHV